MILPAALPAIQVAGLTKSYRIGAAQERHDTFRDFLTAALAAPFRRLRKSPAGQAPGASADEGDVLWALREVSFEVDAGAVVGIVGRNGAGKSTLLKVLSQITEPTAGYVDLRGRVASLLEVGTGFHPELTGRENIYLNGAILGMSRREIDQSFDQIVAFAEVERFIDTPVKRYSSGMYLRLAFAVAAHLEPEILVVDEVLAVGDVQFQRKCTGKMADISRAGRTVLFVSHNIPAVRALCERVIWLDHGRVRMSGPTETVLREYLRSPQEHCTEREWPTPDAAPGSDQVRLASIVLRSEGPGGEAFSITMPLNLDVEYWNFLPNVRMHLTLLVLDQEGSCVFASTSMTDPTWHGRGFPEGRFRSRCRIPGHFLNAGAYSIRLLMVRDGATVLHQFDDILTFEVQDDPETRDGWFGAWPGAVRPRLQWNTELVEASSPV